MSDLLVYPPVGILTFPLKRTPEFKTIESVAVSAYRNPTALWANPIWHWDLKYTALRDDPNNIPAGYTDTEWRTLLGFFVLQKGIDGSFLYKDPTDNSVGPGITGVSTPNLNAELQLWEDTGGTWYSPIQRILGGTTIGATEDITDLVGGNVMSSLTLYENGAPSSTGGTLGGPGLAVAGNSCEGLYIQWNAEPTAPITAKFNFYFRCSFEKDDDFDGSWFTSSPNRFEYPSVKFKSVRAAPQI